MDYVKVPYRAATSPTAKRTYLGTFLFVAAAAILMCIAALAYPVLYYNYVPKKVVSVPVHLQYHTAPNPYGITSLEPNLMREQAYDVSVELTLPRSPSNLQRGNFMVALYAMKSTPENPALFPATLVEPVPPPDLYSHVTKDNVVFTSRRLVLIPYEDPLVSLASRILFLAYHILFARTAQTDTLTIPMGELVEFRGALPLSIFLDVQAGQDLQVYSCSVTLVARLSGLRWFMYNHRILSFFAFTTVFWCVEILSLGIAWTLIGLRFSGRKKDMDIVKTEGGNGRRNQQATKAWYSSGGDGEGSPVVTTKNEDDTGSTRIKDESTEEQTLVSTPRAGGYGDADDEDDYDDGGGTGTGREQKGGSLRRRSSHGMKT
ncbi:hypothetical protein F5Y16DRAFT_372041 [Xylariaceae sp. FL0255]|nr:hypothetical protein F5Y16DRAFT_372041 [Xylariaceae sp. FL0255]